MENAFLNKLFSLDGKVALVTGGAYGIGFAIGSGVSRSRSKNRL